MTWTINEEEGKLLVALDGRFVASNAPMLREDVLGRMDKGTNVLFDLSRMAHIDSSGLGVLVQVLQKAKSCGGKVVLAGGEPPASTSTSEGLVNGARGDKLGA